jgi:hypothetical protein
LLERFTLVSSEILTAMLRVAYVACQRSLVCTVGIPVPRLKHVAREQPARFIGQAELDSFSAHVNTGENATMSDTFRVPEKFGLLRLIEATAK